MNDYNYDYMNYLSNNMNNIGNNYIIPSNNILEPYEGLIRGNLFNNLYNQYQNYKPNKLNPNTEKEALLEQWQQYNFALIDLNLYLDTNPNDINVLAIYKEFLNIKKQLQDKYESKYGPISINSNYIINNSWQWDNGPWPWEGVK